MQKPSLQSLVTMNSEFWILILIQASPCLSLRLQAFFIPSNQFDQFISLWHFLSTVEAGDVWDLDAEKQSSDTQQHRWNACFEKCLDWMKVGNFYPDPFGVDSILAATCGGFVGLPLDFSPFLVWLPFDRPGLGHSMGDETLQVWGWSCQSWNGAWSCWDCERRKKCPESGETRLQLMCQNLGQAQISKRGVEFIPHSVMFDDRLAKGPKRFK